VVGWQLHAQRSAQRWNVLARPRRTGGHEVASLKEITQAALAAKRTISKEMLRHEDARAFARGRGLSQSTAESLIAHGLDLPERLLFMTESAIQEIPGIGETALAEIRAYRARFEQKD
jgi:hypothetical protein